MTNQGSCSCWCFFPIEVVPSFKQIAIFVLSDARKKPELTVDSHHQIILMISSWQMEIAQGPIKCDSTKFKCDSIEGSVTDWWKSAFHIRRPFRAQGVALSNTLGRQIEIKNISSKNSSTLETIQNPCPTHHFMERCEEAQCQR